LQISLGLAFTFYLCQRVAVFHRRLWRLTSSLYCPKCRCIWTVLLNEVFPGRQPRQEIYKIRRFGDCLHHYYPNAGNSQSPKRLILYISWRVCLPEKNSLIFVAMKVSRYIILFKLLGRFFLFVFLTNKRYINKNIYRAYRTNWIPMSVWLNVNKTYSRRISDAPTL
jgi:hypothetical protein